MLSRAITPKRKGRNWLTALAALSVLTGTLVFSSSNALALTQSSFELDKDATDNVTSLHLGTLKSSVNASATSITVCTFTTGVYPAPPFTILIDGEQMTVNAPAGATSNKTGGCGFGDPALIASGTQVYNVTRGVNSSTAAAHSGGADVTRLASVTDGDDWSQVYAEVLADPDTKCTDIGAVECAWIADPKATDETYFTGGGSKDDLDINDQGDPDVPDGPWLNTNSSVPPSDEILDGFAAKYEDGGRQLLFFGADRWTTNGAKDFGFWFFKNPVAADTVANDFSGTHTLGDILILGTFSQGGAVTTIRVFSWVGSGGDVNGVLQTEGNFGDCVPGGGTGNGCNTVNDTTIKSPWPYQGGQTGQVAGSIYAGGMLEGGIDLTALGLTGCFSSFMAETRSSPSIGAQLKDFVLGTFEACGSTITTATTETDGTFEIGGSIRDTATLNVTGGGPAPTGFIDFYVCGPTAGITSCDATGTAAGHINLSTATGTPPDYTVTSNLVTPTAAGDYCFYAEYPADQDTNYPDGAFPTAFTNECFTVTPKQPTISTNASASVLVGQLISDTATLSGTANQPDGDPAGGTITFRAYAPGDTTCTGTPAFTSAAIPVSGDDTYNSGTFTATTAGVYRWIASYTGDLPNTLAVAGACNDANENVTITPKQPSITTDATADPPTGAPLGTAISDSATLSGTAADPDGSVADGSITFRLYGPNDATCTGTPVFTSAAIPVSGDGTYNSGNFTPTAAGTYRWIASYTGDAPNTLAVAGVCNDANEASLIISLTPVITTGQFFYPNDAATVTVGSGAGDLAGSVRLRAWLGDVCTGTPLIDQTRNIVTQNTGTGTTLSRTVETTNTTIRVSATTHIVWRVDYDSTQPGQEDVTGACGTEHSELVITNS